jgi:hypothetical protein
MPDSPAQHLRCVEVQDGSQLTASGVERGGLGKPFGEGSAGRRWVLRSESRGRPQQPAAERAVSARCRATGVSRRPLSRLASHPHAGCRSPARPGRGQFFLAPPLASIRPSVRCSSPRWTMCSTVSKTLSREGREMPPRFLSPQGGAPSGPGTAYRPWSGCAFAIAPSAFFDSHAPHRARRGAAKPSKGE